MTQIVNPSLIPAMPRLIMRSRPTISFFYQLLSNPQIAFGLAL